MPSVARCLLFVVSVRCSASSFVVCCSLCIAWCSLLVARCCSLLSVVRSRLSVVCGSLYNVSVCVFVV